MTAQSKALMDIDIVLHQPSSFQFHIIISLISSWLNKISWQATKKYVGRNIHLRIFINKHTRTQINDYQWMVTSHEQMILASIQLLASTSFLCCSWSTSPNHSLSPPPIVLAPVFIFRSSLLPSYGFLLCSKADPVASTTELLTHLLLLSSYCFCHWYHDASGIAVQSLSTRPPTWARVEKVIRF